PHRRRGSCRTRRTRNEGSEHQHELEAPHHGTVSPGENAVERGAERSITSVVMTGPNPQRAAVGREAPGSDLHAPSEGAGGSAPPQWFAQVPAIGYVRRIHMSDPVRAGETTHIGDEVERILGYRASEFLIDPDLWAARIHPDDLGRVFGAWRRTSEVGSRYHLAYRMLARDRDLVHVFDSAPAG